MTPAYSFAVLCSPLWLMFVQERGNDNDRQTDDVTSGKRDVVTHARSLAVERCAESSLNFF